ncbi:NAD(P)/FAD-dependent oxidoreductase [Peribacillus kribbensis]|uniref:NAD(P)/FAD-dependent oxidoreductase n=1 Tax=Peribacillus kribbensis TaxID=356658 RepID=UPI00041E82D7|nr:FAD-dependent oxidoreductase [Peribacillus kribbensis]
MGKKTIVVAGGGYAGINFVHALQKINTNHRIILIDKNAFHFKKVKLFKGIVSEDISDLHVPFAAYCKKNAEFVQGRITAVHPEEKIIEFEKKEGVIRSLSYDTLVLAMGSVIEDINPEQGGVALTNLERAIVIRQELLEMLDSPKKMLRIAIAGGGITGIETAAEAGAWLKHEGEKRGFEPGKMEIVLIHKKERLVSEAPAKISERLEGRLKKHGIKVIYQKTAERFIDHSLYFSDQSHLEADYCIWTVGLKPHPCLRGFGLPLTDEGKVRVDPWYRVADYEALYAIGDCVHAVDARKNHAAPMSCKEAISQAQRLAKILTGDDDVLPSVPHQHSPELLCIGLGPGDGLVWARKWGMDFAVSGKVAEKIREYTWDLASINQ